jgi:hypothetical protein
MTTVVRVVIGLIWVLSLLAGRGMLHSAAGTLQESSAVAGPDTTAVFEGETGESTSVADDRERPQHDLFGNEVEKAVADYRIDRRGAVYERHAPDMAVPKLGSPVS